MTPAATASRSQNGATPAANAGGEGGKKAKAQATGQKLMIRHLPPLITEEEVHLVLGEQWNTGNGKVDWAQFHPGKVSKSSFKEPRPAMYALHIIKDEDVPIFKDFVLRATWHDAKNTYTMAAFQAHAQDVSTRVPPTKHRVDPRQGTIDQDPEFQAFLHALTQPKAQSKETENGDQPTSANDESGKENKVSNLVKFIKEKKAAKAKEAAAIKSAKHSRQDSQGGKAKAGDDSKKKGKDSKGDKSDKDKDKLKEPVPKLLTKKAAAQEAAAEAAKQAAGQTGAAKSSEDAAPKSRRANIAQAAKILQRDLGLSPGSAHRRARQNAAKAEAATSAEPPTSTAAEKETAEAKEVDSSKGVPTGPKAQGAETSRRSRGKAKAAATATTTSESSKGKDATAKPTTGPIILLKKEANKKEDATPATQSSTSTPAASTPATTPAPPTGPKAGKGAGGKTNASAQPQQKKGVAQPSPGATRAFVKHANPSQGITEPLLKQAMESFGTVTFVEIDKRKGFAYVDFGDTEALRKAVAASPISIAQGTVQVLERKDKKAAPPTPAQPAPTEKTVGESPASPAASTPADRPKRGNRGRGRRGGGASTNAPTGTTNAGNSTTSSTAPAAG